MHELESESEAKRFSLKLTHPQASAFSRVQLCIQPARPNTLCQSVAGNYIKSPAACPPQHQCLQLVPRPPRGLTHFDSPDAALMSVSTLRSTIVIIFMMVMGVSTESSCTGNQGVR